AALFCKYRSLSGPRVNALCNRCVIDCGAGDGSGVVHVIPSHVTPKVANTVRFDRLTNSKDG
ncbi:MAG: hypothetical protein WAT93_03740, partial [Pontixanthobacter sp.]